MGGEKSSKLRHERRVGSRLASSGSRFSSKPPPEAGGRGCESWTGSRSSNFVCGDVEGCYESLRKAKHPDPAASVVSLVESADIANPDGAYLFKVVRQRTAEGVLEANRGMPQTPVDFYYSADEVTLMKAWIKAGAKND